MTHDMIGGGMMWCMGLIWLLVLVVLVLSIAALVNISENSCPPRQHTRYLGRAKPDHFERFSLDKKARWFHWGSNRASQASLSIPETRSD